MKIVSASGAEGPVASTAASGLGVDRSSQRACNSATNAAGSISSCWTSVLRQYVAKKSDSDGSREDEQPAKKNWWLDSRDSRVLLDMRTKNRPSQSGISQPINNIA